MKKVLFLLIPVALFIACKNKPAQQLKNTDSPAGSTQPSPLKKMAAIAQGVWVKADYIEKIRQTKSVLASVDLVVGMDIIQIDSKLINAEGLKARVGWDNQNPGTVLLENKPGKLPNTLRFGEGDLSYSVANGDTALIFYAVYQNSHYQTRYKHILPVSADRNPSDVMNYAINRALIAGNYILTPSVGKTTKVTFTNDGLVTGLAGFKKYFIENDLKPAPLKNLDLITFDEFSSGKAMYSYLFKGNVLELYEAKPDAKATVMVLGKLKYTLVRTQ